MERRAVLRSLAAATVATGGAGCIGGESEDGTGDGEAGGDGEGPLEVAGTTFTVTDTGCGAARSEVSVKQDDDAVVVEGTIPAGGDATTAELLGASYDASDDRLRVAVGTASRGGGGGGCPTVVGYRATVELAGGRPGATSVYHDGVRVGAVDAGGASVSEASFAVEEVAAGEAGRTGRDAATPTVDGGRLVVEGEIAASDGCATAVLDGVAVGDGGDGVTVDVATIPRTGGPCAEGGTTVAYRAVVRFVGTAPRTVTVRHDGARIAGYTAARGGDTASGGADGGTGTAPSDGDGSTADPGDGDSGGGGSTGNDSGAG